MNPERVCYGCFAEKEPGIPCPRCGFNENDEQTYLALPLGTILNGRYLVGKVLGIGGRNAGAGRLRHYLPRL